MGREERNLTQTKDALQRVRRLPHLEGEQNLAGERIKAKHSKRKKCDTKEKRLLIKKSNKTTNTSMGGQLTE